MANTPEGIVKDVIKKGFKELHIYPFEKALARVKSDKPIIGYYMMPASNGMGEAGIGDFLACILGDYIEVEVKSDTGKASGIQKAHAEVVYAAGGDPYLVKGVEDAHKFLTYLTDRIESLLHAQQIAGRVSDALTQADKNNSTSH